MVNSNSQYSVDILSILIRELWVFTLHRGETATSFHSSFIPNADNEQNSIDYNAPSPVKMSKDTNTSTGKSTEKKSLLGTISLPRASEFEEESLGKPSASDVPSHSSASSEDEEVSCTHF